MQGRTGSGDETGRGRGAVSELVRVAHLSSGHHADDARVFWKECLSLARAGYDVSLTVPEEYPSRLPGLPAEVQVGVVRNRPGRFGRLVVTPWALLAAGRRRDADIYHIHEPELLPIGLLLRLSGRKVVYDVHEDVPRDILVKSWIPAGLRGAVAAAAGTLEWIAGRALSGVIAATPAIARRFPSDRTALVQNFARISEFGSCAERPRDDCPALAYVGQITEDRCAPEMVQALARLERFPHVRLIMAGPIAPAGLHDTLAALPGWCQVDYRGLQGRSGIQRILAQARIGLVLFQSSQNYIEALPVKLFEYMAAGMPIVAADFPKLREIVEGNRCGFCVPSRDVAAVAQAIDWLLAHPADADEMGRRGREAAMNLFSWESEERVLLRFYRHLTHGKHGPVLPRALSKPDRRAVISDAEARRIRTVYAEREHSVAGTLKGDDDNPGNLAIVHETRHRLARILDDRFAKPLPQCRILDLGCGSGSLVGWFHQLGVPASHLFGVDLVPSRVEAARNAYPGCTFHVGNAERLDFPDHWFDLVAVFTVFSSVLDRNMAENLAQTIGRVLARNGAVVWYDMRWPNPFNPNLRAMTRERIRELFPGFELELEPVNLLPPLARRLGGLTSVAYPALASVPPLRTHLLGLLRPPAARPIQRIVRPSEAHLRHDERDAVHDQRETDSTSAG